MTAETAPTFEELWAVMPEKIERNESSYDITLEKWENKSRASYICDDWNFTGIHVGESPTEALGLLAIWLAENGHLKGDG